MKNSPIAIFPTPRHRQFFLILFLSSVSAHANTSFSEWTKPLISEVGGQNQIDLAISVVDVKTQEVLLNSQAEKPMTPASVTKILTSFAALTELGPSSTFVTKIKTTGKVKDLRLGGPVYLVGSGDPLFVSERMWLFANAIQRLNIRAFEGPVYLDSSLFHYEDSIQKRRIDEASDRAYNALLNPLSFNFNTTTIVIRPSVDRKSILVSVDPPNNYVKLINKVTLGAGTTTNISARYIRGTDSEEVYEVSGSMGGLAEEKKLYRNIRNPPIYFAKVLRNELSLRGISFPDTFHIGSPPANAQTLLEFESLPLYQLIDGLNKFSNNFLADQILLTLAAQKNGTPGTFEKGVGIIKRKLVGIGSKTDGLTLANGSGLSRETKLSTAQLMSVLVAATQDLGWGPYLVSSLSTSGTDGTLKERLFRNGYNQNIKGKTGSIRGVSSLAGYAKTKGGRVLAVALILNDLSGQKEDLSPFVDRIYQRIVDWKN